MCVYVCMCVYIYMYVYIIVKVTQLCLTLCDPILQARILEWVAFPFSRGSSQPRDQTQAPALQADFLPAEPQGKPKSTGLGSVSFLQWIFPTQELNWGLLHCRQILYELSYCLHKSCFNVVLSEKIEISMIFLLCDLQL